MGQPRIERSQLRLRITLVQAQHPLAMPIRWKQSRAIVAQWRRYFGRIARHLRIRLLEFNQLAFQTIVIRIADLWRRLFEIQLIMPREFRAQCHDPFACVRRRHSGRIRFRRPCRPGGDHQQSKHQSEATQRAQSTAANNRPQARAHNRRGSSRAGPVKRRTKLGAQAHARAPTGQGFATSKPTAALSPATDSFLFFPRSGRSAPSV